MLITNFIPRVASANQDVLADLPYNNLPIIAKTIMIFAGKATVLSGNLNYEYGLRFYINHGLSHYDNNIQNQLNLLYFEIKSGKNDLKSFRQADLEKFWLSAAMMRCGYHICPKYGNKRVLPVIVYVCRWSSEGNFNRITGSFSHSHGWQNHYDQYGSCCSI